MQNLTLDEMKAVSGGSSTDSGPEISDFTPICDGGIPPLPYPSPCPYPIIEPPCKEDL